MVESLPSSTPSGLPRDDYTLSFWLAQTRSSKHLNLRSSADLPDQADIVIIGSGLSGVSLAYFLLLHNQHLNIVMLEARQFCSGATGRNGGHCRPDTYLGYPGYKKRFGAKQAMHLFDLELETLDLMQELVEKEGIDCDFWRGEGLDVFMSNSIKQEAFEALQEYEKDGGTIKNHWIGDQTKAFQLSRVKGTVAACSYPAGQLFPYKLTSGLLDRCLAKGLNFQSTTAATSIIGSANSWQVQTPRGIIRSRQVACCTNAYTGAILPALRRSIIPIRGHCAAITPTKAFSGNHMLKTTQIIRWGKEQLPDDMEGDFEYLIQRPSDGKVIVGGRSDAGWLDTTDDSIVVSSSSKALAEYMSQNYEGWSDERPGEGLSEVWTGIMGLTSDHIPFVGTVPGQSGQFLSAAHNGHGMARILPCSQGLAKLMAAGPDAAFEVSGLPSCLQWTDDRIPSPDWHLDSHHKSKQSTVPIPA